MKWILVNKSASDKGNYRVLAMIGVALIAAYIVSSFVINVNRIVGISMEPTLKENDWVLINRLAYIKGNPEVDDIVIFHKKSVTNEIMVKRIIAIPGDTVAIRNGILYVNGEMKEDSFEKMPSNESLDTLIVQEKCYFVLGDNRNHSFDSRFWDNPFVTEKEIIGKVIF